MRWRLRLCEFDFQVKYKKGILNTQADALSRLKTTGLTIVPIEEDIPCFVMEEADGYEDVFDDITTAGDEVLVASRQEEQPELTAIMLEELLRSQMTDTYCASIRSRLDGGEDIPFSEDESGILIRTVTAWPQIVVPMDIRARVLHLAHYPKTAGHPGWRKLYYTLRREF